MTGRGRVDDCYRYLSGIPVGDVLTGFYFSHIKAFLDTREVVLEPVSQAPYCVAVSKECKYYDEINAAVKVLIKNGTTDELYAKWCE